MSVSGSTTDDAPLLAGFASLEERLAGSGPEWLVRRRAEARERLRASGFPTPSDEDWRATNVRPIVEGTFSPGSRETAAPTMPGGVAALELGGPRLVLVDGHYRPELSRVGDLPDGVICGSLAASIAAGASGLEKGPESWLQSPDQRGAFADLNDSLLEDAALVVVPAGVRLERPVQIVHVSGAAGEATASQFRSCLRVGDGAFASVVECFVSAGDGRHFTNAVTDAEVGNDGELIHHRVQDENPAAYHVATLDSRQGRDSRYAQHNFNLGGRLVRNNIRAVLDGEGAHCLLNGLYVTRGEQHVDHHTILDHAKPHGDSREVYRGVLGDSSRAVFSGRIIVREGAQKTDAKQSNPNILLSDRALAQTRPQLEIYADDVKCTHGATVGRLDADAIFYLRSRGIPADAARNLLIRAFTGEVLDRVGDETLRAWLEQAVDRRLPSEESAELREPAP